MQIHTAETITDSHGITPNDLLHTLFRLRSINAPETFLKPPHPENLTLETFGYGAQAHDLITRLETSLNTKEQIIIYTDYDADGITGGALLWEAMHLLGFSVHPYVPHRQTEGYGFSEKGIDALISEHNPGLIISVDHGISAHTQIAYAQSQGVSVIVTDHHTRQETDPPAEIIIHIPTISGSAVAYMVAKTLIEAFRDHIPSKKRDQLTQALRSDYLCLASIGSIADLVPLTNETRQIVSHGIQAFQSTRRPGLQALCEDAQIPSNQPISPYHIGFQIAPRINAVGRLDHALDAVRLLCTTQPSRARQLAKTIGQLNRTRQEMVRTAIEEAEAQIEEQYPTADELPQLLVLHSADWHEGIIGLIASHLTEKYYRPSMITTGDTQVLKGAARSVHGIAIPDLLNQLKPYLTSFGGHAMAGGFSMPADQYPRFRDQALQLSTQFPREAITRKIKAELGLPLSLLTLELAHLIEQMQPFGIGNPRPVFHTNGIVARSSVMGKDSSHLKLQITDPSEPGQKLEVVAFGRGEDKDALTTGTPIELVLTLDINRWKNTERLQGKLLHWQKTA